MASEALIETWCLYTVGSLIIFARVGCRWRMVGLANFRPDDYIILLSWVSQIGPSPNIRRRALNPASGQPC